MSIYIHIYIYIYIYIYVYTCLWSCFQRECWWNIHATFPSESGSPCWQPMESINLARAFGAHQMGWSFDIVIHFEGIPMYWYFVHLYTYIHTYMYNYIYICHIVSCHIISYHIISYVWYFSTRHWVNWVDHRITVCFTRIGSIIKNKMSVCSVSAVVLILWIQIGPMSSNSRGPITWAIDNITNSVVEMKPLILRAPVFTSSWHCSSMCLHEIPILCIYI